MNARSLALGLITDGVGIDFKEADVQGWVEPGDGYERLAAWLEPIPLELPGKGPTDEMRRKQPVRDVQEAA
ncbi:hypothetical protein Tco_0579859 [Tanacetum coccineum]